MSATNKKKSNKTELNKLGKKDKTGKPRKKAVKQTIAPDATVTIKPRTVKIEPAA